MKRPVLTADQAAEVERHLSPGGLTAAEVLALPLDLQRLLLMEARTSPGGADSHKPTAADIEAVCGPSRKRQDAERDWLALHHERERLRIRQLRRRSRRRRLAAMGREAG